MCAGHRPDLCGGEFPDRHFVLTGESENPAMSATTIPPAEVASQPGTRARQKFLALARRNPLAAAGIFLVALFTVFAIFAPWIAPQDPAYIELTTRLSRPSFSHWLGTDELGRDLLSRIIVGARISMLVGTCVVATS